MMTTVQHQASLLALVVILVASFAVARPPSSSHSRDAEERENLGENPFSGLFHKKSREISANENSPSDKDEFSEDDIEYLKAILLQWLQQSYEEKQIDFSTYLHDMLILDGLKEEDDLAGQWTKTSGTEHNQRPANEGDTAAGRGEETAAPREQQANGDLDRELAEELEGETAKEIDENEDSLAWLERALERDGLGRRDESTLQHGTRDAVTAREEGKANSKTRQAAEEAPRLWNKEVAREETANVEESDAAVDHQSKKTVHPSSKGDPRKSSRGDLARERAFRQKILELISPRQPPSQANQREAEWKRDEVAAFNDISEMEAAR